MAMTKDDFVKTMLKNEEWKKNERKRNEKAKMKKDIYLDYKRNRVVVK